jgi:hypothetical protein
MATTELAGGDETSEPAHIQSPSQAGDKVVAGRFPERWVTATDELIWFCRKAVPPALSGYDRGRSGNGALHGGRFQRQSF